MKLIALLGAGALAAGTIAGIPAEAQRYGHERGWRGDDGWRGHDRGYRGYRGDGWRGSRHYRGGYGYGDRYGYRSRGYHGGRGYYGRPRVVCRVRPSYYGPVRRCFRTY